MADDLDSLVKQANTAPSTAWITDDVKRVKDIESQRDKELAPEREKFKRGLDEDRSEVEKARKAIDPVDVQPWKEKPPENDPLQRFGSLGSVFGILASAFTHQPWQNAMNAAAGAMNASRAGDLERYKSAYDAWKSNSSLMIQRHEMQMRDYEAAQRAMQIDVTSGTAMLKELGAKYGDQITSVMTEAGMMDKLDQAWKSRAEVARGLVQTQLQMEGIGIQRMQVLNQESHNKALEKIATDRQIDERERDKRRDEEMQRWHRESAEIKRLEAEHKDAKNQVKTQQAVDNYDLAINQIDDLIDKAGEGGVTGAAGMAKRGLESAEGAYHFFTGDEGETPAKNFQSALDAMKLQLPKLLTGVSKSAKDERAKIDTILRGTSMGDSKDATVHALQQVKTLLENRRDLIRGGKEVIDDEQAANVFSDAKAAISAGAPRDKVIDAIRARGLEPPGDL